MKISTKFNLFVACFFVFVFMAVLYSYCGGLNVCYSFPFLNGIGKGSVSKVTMTSYVIHEKGVSRDNDDAIYFYSKGQGHPNEIKTVSQNKPDSPKETERRPGDEENNMTNNPPSIITGKIAEDILRKANISLEESNRELFREEKVDKQVDKDASMPTQSTAIEKDRGKLGPRLIHPRAHPIRKPPRRLRKKLRKKRIHQLEKQDRIDKELERKLEVAENVMRMRGNGPGNESRFLRRPYLLVHSKTPVKDLNKMSLNQDETGEMNYANDAVSPLDIIKHRSEALTDTKIQKNEDKVRNGGLTSVNTLRHLRNNTEDSRLHFEKKTFWGEKWSMRTRADKKKFLSEKVSRKKKTNSVRTGEKYDFDQMNDTESRMGSHGNKLTSYGKRHRAVKAKKVDEGSGSGAGVRSDQYRTFSTNELIRTIRTIRDKNIKLSLQSALKKDKHQLQNDVMVIKDSYRESHRPFNLTDVLKQLVKSAETDERAIETSKATKQGIMLKKRNSDRPLVRVKRLGNVRRRNKESERALVRVKRIEDDIPSENELDVQLVSVKRLDSIDDTNVQKIPSNNINNSWQEVTQRKQLQSARRGKYDEKVLALKEQRINGSFEDEKLKSKELNTRQTHNDALSKQDRLATHDQNSSNQYYTKNTLKAIRNLPPRTKDVAPALVRVKRINVDDGE